MNSPNVSFDEINLSFASTAPAQGVQFIQAITKRGPVEDPSLLITSWAQFQKVYGGFITGATTAQKIKRALERGSTFRVSRLVHYTDPTDDTTIDADKAVLTNWHLLTADAAFVSLNSIAMTINGVAITPVVYATSSDNTLELLATEIAAHAAVESAVVIPVAGGTTNDRQIIIYSATGAALTFTSVAVTLGASQPTLTITAETMITNNDGQNLFAISAKYHGADYNNVSVEIADASNGQADYFNLVVTHALEPSLNETYANIKIPSALTAAESKYLDAVNRNSNLITITYQTLTGYTDLYPIRMTLPLYNGSDGGAVVDLDVIGDSGAGTGFYAFDQYDDALTMCCLETTFADATYLALTNYCAARKDLVALIYIESSADPNTMITDRDSINYDTSYSFPISGEGTILDPDTGAEIEIDVLGDVLGTVAYAQRKWGYGTAVMGYERGLIYNMLSIANNYGSQGKQTDANLLANRQINLVQSRSGTMMIWGNITGQKASDSLSFLDIRYYLIGLKKEIKPIAERFIGQKNTFPNWRKLYMAIDPILKNHKERDRYIYEYSYQGDQFATNLDALTVNTKTDVGLGKYKARIYLKPTPAMNEIAFDLVITETSVSFEEVSELV